MNTVYEFCYCDNIHEGQPGTISIHRTKKGAEIAMEFHKERQRQKFNEMIDRGNVFNLEFGRNEAWFITETEILD